jgi:hypothetical protein
MGAGYPGSASLLVGGLIALSTSGCYGLSSESRYPDFESSELDQFARSPEYEKDPSIGIDNDFVITEQLCEGLDTHTETRPIAQDDLLRFLERVGKPPAEIKARGNLYWFEFPGDDPNDGDVVRLRLAVLDSPEEAADELHRSLLQHGPGWWGIRRSNISILAPKSGLGDAMAFAVHYKLPCWGAMMRAGLDDVYVIPGPYTEL